METASVCLTAAGCLVAFLSILVLVASLVIAWGARDGR